MMNVRGAALPRTSLLHPRRFGWCFAALATIFGCQSKTRVVHESGAEMDPSSAPVVRFGSRLTVTPTHPISEVLANPTAFTERTLQVEGHVRRACSRRGCWMELATGPEDALPGCRVTFKDYGFFVPTDAAGAQARVEGNLFVRRVGPAKVAHYEAEGARFPDKAPDGSANELQFVATGVELTR
jgi:Domain of unknown function (DUF4920)